MGYLYLETDHGRSGLIFASLETDAGSLVYQTLFMMQEGFLHYGCIQKSKGAGIPVPFLQGHDPLCWGRHSLALIVFPNPDRACFVLVFGR